MAAALENMESTMVFRRPKRSAKCPPKAEASKCPTPYAPIAMPASVCENPRRVRYKARKGMTKAPNLLRNVPKKRIQIGRGRPHNCCQSGATVPGGGDNTAPVSVNDKTGFLFIGP